MLLAKLGGLLVAETSAAALIQNLSQLKCHCAIVAVKNLVPAAHGSVNIRRYARPATVFCESGSW